MLPMDLFLRASLQIVELLKCFNGLFGIDQRRGFAHRMHAPHGVAHIDATHGKLCGQGVAKRTTTHHVGTIHKILERYTGLATYLGKDGSRIGIGDILLIGIELDDRAATHYRMVRRVVLLGIIGVQGVCHVGRYHK